jgi:hypothetical protein
MGNPKGNEHEGLHAEIDYLYDAVMADGVVEKAYPEDPGFGSRRSVNIKETERVVHAVGTYDWKPIIEMVKRMKTEGLDLYEFEPSSHLQIVMAALGCMLLVASKRGIREAVELGVWYFQCVFKLCSLCDAGGSIGPWMPCARPTLKKGEMLANSEPRTVAWQVAKGGKLPRRLLANRQFTGAIAISKLPADLRARLTQEPEGLLLPAALRVARREGRHEDYVAWFDEGSKGLLDESLQEPCRVAGVWDGVPFAQANVTAEIRERIALCGSPIVIPGVSGR